MLHVCKLIVCLGVLFFSLELLCGSKAIEMASLGHRRSKRHTEKALPSASREIGMLLTDINVVCQTDQYYYDVV